MGKHTRDFGHTSNFQPSSTIIRDAEVEQPWIVEADWYAVHQDADWFHVSEPTCQVQEIVTCPQKIYTCVNIINLNNRFEFDFVVIDCFFQWWVSFAEFTELVGPLWPYVPKTFLATWYAARVLAYVYVYIDKRTWIISSIYWLCPRKWILEFQGTLSREETRRTSCRTGIAWLWNGPKVWRSCWQNPSVRFWVGFKI